MSLPTKDGDDLKREDDGALSSTFIDMALQDETRSASASTIQEDIRKTLHQIEDNSKHRRASRTETAEDDDDAVAEKDSESDVVVVMNVAMKVEGMTKGEFHDLSPAERSKLVGQLIETNVSFNASTLEPSASDAKTGRSGQSDNDDDYDKNLDADSSLGVDMTVAATGDNHLGAEEGPQPQTSSATAEVIVGKLENRNVETENGEIGAKNSFNTTWSNEEADGERASQGSKQINDDDDDDVDVSVEKEAGRVDDDEALEGAPTFGGDVSNENREMGDQESTGIEGEASFKSLASAKGASTESHASSRGAARSINAGPEEENGDGDGYGDDDDDDELSETKPSKSIAGGTVGSDLSIPTDPKKAAELVGSLIGMETAIQRDAPYDAAKMVAFPPLWVSPGAKIVRHHEAELNWKDKMQNWETEKPEQPTVYKIAIKDNLNKLYDKCYGCTNHGLHATCLGYAEKVREISPWKYYENIPTPLEYPVFGKGLVPRKQAQDMQAQRAKQRYQPFGLKDIYQKNKFVLGKNVPYYYRKQKAPGQPPPKLPPLGKRIAKNIQDDRAHLKHTALGGKTRIDDLARPHQYNTCKSYFPAEYLTAFKEPKDQVCFKDVAMFLPAEEKDKVDKTEDMWPKSAREKKKNKRREAD